VRLLDTYIGVGSRSEGLTVKCRDPQRLHRYRTNKRHCGQYELNTRYIAIVLLVGNKQLTNKKTTQ